MLYLFTNKIEFNSQNIKLTPRGKGVFYLIIKGLTDKEIGNNLNISYSAVRRHKEKMIFANGCESMSQLISKYYATYTERIFDEKR